MNPLVTLVFVGWLITQVGYQPAMEVFHNSCNRGNLICSHSALVSSALWDRVDIQYQADHSCPCYSYTAETFVYVIIYYMHLIQKLFYCMCRYSDLEAKNEVVLEEKSLLTDKYTEIQRSDNISKIKLAQKEKELKESHERYWYKFFLMLYSVCNTSIGCMYVQYVQYNLKLIFPDYICTGTYYCTWFVCTVQVFVGYT